MKRTVIIVALLGLVVCVGVIIVSLIIGNSPKETFANNLQTQGSEGIVLHGCKGDVMWLENTNSYSMRVRQVSQYSGEATLSMNLIPPGERLSVGKSNFAGSTGFYLYTLDGVLVGWIRAC